MSKLCLSLRFSFVFGCGLSTSVGNLLKFFLTIAKIVGNLLG